MMKYKGYTGVLEVDEEAGILFGDVIGLRDVITFQGESVEAARTSFHESIDFYLEICAKQDKPPEKPFSGRFLVRITPALHRVLVAEASNRSVSLNTLVDRTLIEAFPETATASVEPAGQAKAAADDVARKRAKNIAAADKAARAARKRAKAAAGAEVKPTPRRTKAG